MRLLIHSAVYAFAVAQANATLVVYDWTPAEILLAADSLRTRVGDGKVKGEIACKIHQEGPVFFTIIGVNDDTTIKVDLVSIARQSARSAGGAKEKLAAFEVAAKQEIERIMRRNLTGMIGFGSPQRVNVVFVDSRSHTLAQRGYIRRPDGTAELEPIKSYGALSRRSGPIAIGVSQEALAVINKSPAILKLNGAEFITEFFKVQIGHEQTRRKALLATGDLRMIPRVGGDVAILRVSGGKATWVAGQRGKCEAVKTY